MAGWFEREEKIMEGKADELNDARDLFKRGRYAQARRACLKLFNWGLDRAEGIRSKTGKVPAEHLMLTAIAGRIAYLSYFRDMELHSDDRTRRDWLKFGTALINVQTACLSWGDEDEELGNCGMKIIEAIREGHELAKLRLGQLSHEHQDLMSELSARSRGASGAGGPRCLRCGKPLPRGQLYCAACRRISPPPPKSGPAGARRRPGGGR